jgi:AraC family transcriptional regulator
MFMNHNADVIRALDFIEAHLKENLTAQAIAGYTGYSVYHFYRIFKAEKQVSLMDYIRRRRLTLARRELLTEAKIINIAMEYGYETPGGFTKAFHKEFGYSPTKYLARMKCHVEIDNTNEGGFVITPTIIKKPAFKAAGYGIKTNISGSFTKDIAAYWTNYPLENLETKMYDILKPPQHGEVGICITTPGEEHVTYLLGVIVEDFKKVTQEMLKVNVPAATYAVFTTPPVDTSKNTTYEDNLFSQSIRDTWKHIFEEWFPASGYVFDESKLDYEFYDERCHSRPDSVMEIRVPVKKKTAR